MLQSPVGTFKLEKSASYKSYLLLLSLLLTISISEVEKTGQTRPILLLDCNKLCH